MKIPVSFKKSEKEITLGLYRDDETGEFVTRKKDEKTGEFLESEFDYINRIKQTTEYKKVHAVADWLENKTKGKLYFHDVTSDYSQEAIELEIRKSKVIFKCDIFAIDTMKVDKLESWDRLKMLATKIVEVAKELNMCGYATYQLTDATFFDDIFSLSSNNISGAKGIKHPVDVLLINEEIKKEDFDKYQYIPLKNKEYLKW